MSSERMIYGMVGIALVLLIIWLVPGEAAVHAQVDWRFRVLASIGTLYMFMTAAVLFYLSWGD